MQLVGLVQRAFASRTLAEWSGFLGSLPTTVFNAVYGYDDVLNDPQALENEYITERSIPGVGPRRVVGQPMHFSHSPGIPGDEIPELGQHTELVMQELGFSWEEIEKLNTQTREALRQKFVALGQEPPY